MELELPVLAPSILASDYSKLGEEIGQCLKGGAKWIHCDIMDGHFVPNISFGPDVTAAARRSAPEAFLDVHLMIEKPDNFIEAFADAGADLISVHYEACTHIHRTLQNIQDNGCMAGIVINPGTSAELIEPVLDEVDLVLVMSVNPGFGGQSFINQTYDKIRRIAAIRREQQVEFLIEVDGGVGLKNIQKLVESGADVLVTGSSIFKTGNIADRVRQLQEKANLGHARFA